MTTEKKQRILEVIAAIKKEVGYEKLSDWSKGSGVAHWGGMTNDFFVVHKHEAYGESHERVYSWELGDLTFKKVSGRYTEHFCHKKLNKITTNFDMDNFDLVDSLNHFFNQNKK